MFAILGILAIACAAGIVLLSDDSSASSFDVHAKENDYGKVSSSLTYYMDYVLDSTEATYEAVLLDSDGNSKGTVSKSPSTLRNTSSRATFTISLPSDAGDYTLKVTVTEGSDENKVEYVRTAYVRAVDPIKLSVTVNNTGAVARSFVAYFYVETDDGFVKAETVSAGGSSKQTIDVAANGSKTVTYDYVVRDASNTTFCLKADDTATIGGDIQGLGEDHAHTYYTSANDYKMIEYLCIGVIVILLIVALWVYRKPIRNFGKPKGRR
jgi:hypothetical protein